MKYVIQKYSSASFSIWNNFIDSCNNATFLFDRNFMDYHSDLFEDHSLMIYENENLIGVVPAHVKDNCFYSHRGLTYGIPITTDSKFVTVFEAIMEYLTSSAFAKAEFNLTPHFYNSYNKMMLSELLSFGFEPVRVSNNMSVDLRTDLKISPKKSIGYRNGKFEDLFIEKKSDFKSFWNLVLIPSLKIRHDSKPVHTLKEIELLASRFPEKIIQHNVYRDEELLGGITFFIKGNVIKSQYAASTPAGMKTDAVGFIYMEAMKEYKKLDFHFMDLGPVNEFDGSINEGLLRFKKQLGSEMEEVLRLEKHYETKNH